jgi:hypothetical protein
VSSSQSTQEPDRVPSFGGFNRRTIELLNCGALRAKGCSGHQINYYYLCSWGERARQPDELRKIGHTK